MVETETGTEVTQMAVVKVMNLEGLLSNVYGKLDVTRVCYFYKLTIRLKRLIKITIKYNYIDYFEFL